MLKNALFRGAVFAVATFSILGTASAEVLFGGVFIVTAVTPQCQQDHLGYAGTSHFHPNIAGNGNTSQISFVFQFGGSGYSLTGHAFDTTFRNVQAVGIAQGGPGNWTGSQIRFIAQGPATITTSTRFVNIRGQISRFENDDGGAACVATFEASYIRHL